MGKVKQSDDWQAHPRFARVFLKPLVKGDMNPGINVNLVRIAPGGEITPHVHPNSTETYYILKGKGTAWVGKEQFALEPGVCAYAPPDVTHSVCNTGEEELEAMSIFNPPL